MPVELFVPPLGVLHFIWYSLQSNLQSCKLSTSNLYRSTRSQPTSWDRTRSPLPLEHLATAPAWLYLPSLVFLQDIAAISCGVYTSASTRSNFLSETMVICPFEFAAQLRATSPTSSRPSLCFYSLVKL